MNSLFGIVYLLLAFLCGSTEFKHFVSVHSESVDTPSAYHLDNVTSYVCRTEIIRGVSSHLTWEMILF